jgi:hypothetical protein
LRVSIATKFLGEHKSKKVISLASSRENSRDSTIGSFAEQNTPSRFHRDPQPAGDGLRAPSRKPVIALRHSRQMASSTA